MLLRLVLPFTIPSAFSVYTLVNPSISASPFFEAEAGNLTSAISRENFIIVQGAGQSTANIPTVSIWFAVWFAGMILFGIFFSVIYFRCLFEFRTALPVNNALGNVHSF